MTKSRPTRHEPPQEARIPRAVSLNEGGSNYLSWLSLFPRRLYPALRIPVISIADSSVMPITDSTLSDHQSERSDAGCPIMG